MWSGAWNKAHFRNQLVRHLPEDLEVLVSIPSRGNFFALPCVKICQIIWQKHLSWKTQMVSVGRKFELQVLRTVIYPFFIQHRTSKLCQLKISPYIKTLDHFYWKDAVQKYLQIHTHLTLFITDFYTTLHKSRRCAPRSGVQDGSRTFPIVLGGGMLTQQYMFPVATILSRNKLILSRIYRESHGSTQRLNLKSPKGTRWPFYMILVVISLMIEKFYISTIGCGKMSVHMTYIVNTLPHKIANDQVNFEFCDGKLRKDDISIEWQRSQFQSSLKCHFLAECFFFLCRKAFYGNISNLVWGIFLVRSSVHCPWFCTKTSVLFEIMYKRLYWVCGSRHLRCWKQRNYWVSQLYLTTMLFLFQLGSW